MRENQEKIMGQRAKKTAMERARKHSDKFNDRSHEGSGLTGNQQLPVDLSSIGRLKATCPIFEDGHGDHGY